MSYGCNFSLISIPSAAHFSLFSPRHREDSMSSPFLFRIAFSSFYMTFIMNVVCVYLFYACAYINFVGFLFFFILDFPSKQISKANAILPSSNRSNYVCLQTKTNFILLSQFNILFFLICYSLLNDFSRKCTTIIIKWLSIAIVFNFQQ